jgi:ApbE superfamily uncharacterized protein (UPF0280 family)
MTVENLFKQFFQFKETNCLIISDKKKAINEAMSTIRLHRNELDKYVRINPKFLYSLEPVSAKNGPLIAKLMDEESRKANVGPLAAVAGTLADLAVKDMIELGCKTAIVENGGEISAFSNRPIDVALLAGDSPFSKRVGFRIKEFPIGIATSSGLFSHALSFGEADAVTVFALNAGLADAVSTAVGNLIIGDDCREAINRGIDEALPVEGVKGVFISYKGFVGRAGQIPEMIKFLEQEDPHAFSAVETV